MIEWNNIWKMHLTVAIISFLPCLETLKKIIDSVLKIWFRNEVFVVDQSGVLSACNAGDAAEASGSIPRWKDPPEKEVVIHPNILA